jgi:acyl-CoA dehydrogenase
MQYAFAQIQQAFEGIFCNWSAPILGPLFRSVVTGWWRLNPIGTLPDDELGSLVTRQLQTPGPGRDRLTAGIYISSHPDEALGRLERALDLSVRAEPILKKMKVASRDGQLPQAKPEKLIEVALAAQVITEAEAKLVCEAEAARNEAIQVDAFTLLEYRQVGQVIPVAADGLAHALMSGKGQA